MTRAAVSRTLAKAVTSRDFRDRLLSGVVSAEELLNDPELAGLDEQDAKAIVKGAEAKTMKSLGSYLDGYTFAKYGPTPGQLDAYRRK